MPGKADHAVLGVPLPPGQIRRVTAAALAVDAILGLLLSPIHGEGLSLDGKPQGFLPCSRPARRANFADFEGPTQEQFRDPASKQ